MSDADARSTRENIDGADTKLAHDRHLAMEHLSKSVDNVRLKERQPFNDDVLNGRHFPWLPGFERLSERKKMKYDTPSHHQLKTGVARSLTENLRHLWRLPNIRAANDAFRDWHGKCRGHWAEAAD